MARDGAKGVMVHAWNARVYEVEVKGLAALGHLWLHRELKTSLGSKNKQTSNNDLYLLYSNQGWLC